MPGSPLQIALDLRPQPRWGGRREGAGRKPRPSPRDPHRTRPPLAARFPCHVTLKVRRGIPSLRSVRLVRELERSFTAACEQGRFRVVHYSIQTDHVHLIVEAASSRDLAAGMKSIGARLPRAANRVFSRRGPVLADRYHLHVLRTPRDAGGERGPEEVRPVGRSRAARGRAGREGSASGPSTASTTSRSVISEAGRART